MQRNYSFLLALAAVIAAAAADVAAAPVSLEAFQRPTSIPFPADNPFTLNKGALGAGVIGSMNTALGRRAPTVLKHAWGEHFFWDGRAASLEEQVRGPIEADVEMNMPMVAAVRRLAAIDGYREWFDDVSPAKA